MKEENLFISQLEQEIKDSYEPNYIERTATNALYHNSLDPDTATKYQSIIKILGLVKNYFISYYDKLED